VAPVGIGHGRIGTDVRQGPRLQKEFEGRVVAVCGEPKGTQILTRAQAVSCESQRTIRLNSSKLAAEFQGLTASRAGHLLLDLIYRRTITQRNFWAVADQAHPCNVEHPKGPAGHPGNRETRVCIYDRS